MCICFDATDFPTNGNSEEALTQKLDCIEAWIEIMILIRLQPSFTWGALL